MIKIILSILSISLLIGCTSINQSRVYDGQKINSIKTWSLEFMYEPGEISKTESDNSKNETTVKRFGNYPILLGLKDDIFYHLKDNYSIKIKKDDENAEGKILLNPVSFDNYVVYEVDIIFFSSDNKDEALARLKANSLDGLLNIEKDSAEEIAKILNLK